MNNDILGAFIAGIGCALIVLAVFQIGVNIGIRSSLFMLEETYPAAFKFLKKNQKTGNVLPYVVNGE